LLAEAKKRAPENVEFTDGDANELPFPSDSFDLVSTARTLHHLERPELVLAEMSRVLKPGGRAVLLVADVRALRDAARAGSWIPIRQLRVRVLGQPATIMIVRRPQE